MNRHARTVLVVAAVLVVVTVVFARYNEPFRRQEVELAARIISWLFPSVDVTPVGTLLVLAPENRPFIVAKLIPSCSALASLLAVGCLGLITPRGTASRSRRAAALLTALVVVGVGNLIRITASLAVGAVAGRSSLVLFHDVAGSLFTFVAIIGGYTLFLAVLLPKESRPSPLPEVLHGVPA